MTRRARILGTPAPAKADLVVYHWPCGCEAQGTRDNRVAKCVSSRCYYSPTRPAGRTGTVRR